MALPRALAAGLSLVAAVARGTAIQAGSDDAVSLVQQRSSGDEVKPHRGLFSKRDRERQEEADEEATRKEDERDFLLAMSAFDKQSDSQKAQALQAKPSPEPQGSADQDQADFRSFVRAMEQLPKPAEEAKPKTVAVSAEEQDKADLESAMKAVSSLQSVKPAEVKPAPEPKLSAEEQEEREKAEFEGVLGAIRSMRNIPLPRSTDPNVLYARPEAAAAAPAEEAPVPVAAAKNEDEEDMAKAMQGLSDLAKYAEQSKDSNAINALQKLSVRTPNDASAMLEQQYKAAYEAKEQAEAERKSGGRFGQAAEKVGDTVRAWYHSLFQRRHKNEGLEGADQGP